MLSQRQAILAAAALTFNAFVWGVSWWPLRQLQGLGLHPLWTTVFIFAFSLAGLSVFKPNAWRGLPKHPMLWLLLVTTGLTNVGFNWAFTTGDVVRVVLLFYLMPAWTVLLAWPMLGERPGMGSMLRLALALCGLIVVLKTPSSPWPVPESLPDWLALMAGFTFSLVNILLRRLRHIDNEFRIFSMFAGGFVFALTGALIGMSSGLVQAPPAPGLLWISSAALLSVAFLFGNLALQYGASRLRVTTTSLIMLSELAFATVSSVWLGAGDLSARTLYGGGLILLAVLLAAVAPSPSPEPAH